MLTRLLTLIAVMVMIARGWAFLVTVVSPPLTLGWRETLEATVRRSAQHVAVLGIADVVVLLILVPAARPWLVRLLGAESSPATTRADPSRSPARDHQRLLNLPRWRRIPSPAPP